MFISYHVRIKRNVAVHFNATIHYYRQAVDFYIDVCQQNWDAISSIGKTKYQNKYIEELTIPGNKRIGTIPDEINFAQKFPDLPSNLRRAAIKQARGMVSAYKKHLKRWEALPCDKRGKRPGLPTAGKAFPFLYRKHMFRKIDSYHVKIKAYDKGKWKWIEVELCKSDANYIEKHCTNSDKCVPRLIKKNSRWFLQFPFRIRSKIVPVPTNQQIAVGVDMGIHNICTCAVISSKGEILARKFLHDNVANAIMSSIGKKKRRNPQLSISNSIKQGRNQICKAASKFIIDLSLKYGANVVVFENLYNGGMNKCFHVMSRTIQKMVKLKGEMLGIDIQYVCAWNTSRYAYDGSGTVIRNPENPSICTFKSGKIYNCDLSASYNIAARYFIREKLKELSKEQRRNIEAKVPRCRHRAGATLSTLLQLQAALSDMESHEFV